MRRAAPAVALLTLAVGCEKAGERVPAPPAPVAARSDAAPAPPEEEPASEELREAARRIVREGFDPPEDMVELLVAVYGEEEHPVSRQTAQRLIDDEMARLRADEASWTGPTDCDRLDAAFARLERSGILARQNFSDCGTCGAAEMAGLVKEALGRGEKVRGYTFFHDQDTESAVDGGMYLSYGAASDSARASVAIGREVVRALRAEGLTVDWDGTIERRIGVTLEWRKRRFSKAPAR